MSILKVMLFKKNKTYHTVCFDKHSNLPKFLASVKFTYLIMAVHVCRYFIEVDGKPTLDSLYEEWFHCEDLGSQLGPIIKR